MLAYAMRNRETGIGETAFVSAPLHTTGAGAGNFKDDKPQQKEPVNDHDRNIREQRSESDRKKMSVSIS